MTNLDPVAMSTAIIKAKASAAQKTKTVLKGTNVTIAKLPTGPRPESVICSRAKYLQSIHASEIKAAAKTIGLDVNFGLDAKNWLKQNPQLKDKLSDIMALADQMFNSRNATAEVVSLTSEVTSA